MSPLSLEEKTHRNWETPEATLLEGKNGCWSRREEKLARPECWEEKAAVGWGRSFEGESNGFHQPQTTAHSLEPGAPYPHQPSLCWDPHLTPTELALLRRHLSAKPEAGPAGHSPGLRTHFPGETSWDQPGCITSSEQEEPSQVQTLTKKTLESCLPPTFSSI